MSQATFSPHANITAHHATILSHSLCFLLWEEIKNDMTCNGGDDHIKSALIKTSKVVKEVAQEDVVRQCS